MYSKTDFSPEGYRPYKISFDSSFMDQELKRWYPSI